MLVSGSHDYSTKFWGRSRPGDTAEQYAYQGNPVKLPVYGERNNANVTVVPEGFLTGGAAGPGRSGLAAASLSGLVAMTFEEIDAEQSRSAYSGAAVAAPSHPAQAVPAPAPAPAAAGGTEYGTAWTSSAAAGGAGAAPFAPPTAAVAPLPSTLWGGGAAATAAAAPTTYAAAGDGSDRVQFGGVTGASSTGSRPRRPPPPSYVCNACHIPGHWIDDCPVIAERRRLHAERNNLTLAEVAPTGPGRGATITAAAPGVPGIGVAAPAGPKSVPGPGYVCKRCGQPGHWIQASNSR
jgi:hypothetical protein